MIQIFCCPYYDSTNVAIFITSAINTVQLILNLNTYNLRVKENKFLLLNNKWTINDWKF